MTMKHIVIETKNLTIGYPKTRNREELQVLDNLNISLFAGELTCLLGANGIGKSTLLRTLSNMQPALSGDVLLFKKKIGEYKNQDLSTLLGLVLTDKTSIGGFTVRELVSLGRYPYTGFWGRLSDEDNKVVNQSMADVCIIHKSENYVSDLSDGERQKVMIAKALAQECPIIILDEPTAFLDVINRFEIMNLLHHLAVTKNKAILLSTHDLELAFTLADTLWLVSEKNGLKTGTTEDLILSDSINEYIGNDRLIFDNDQSRFITNQKNIKQVSLEAEGNLYYWAKNFLERNGFSVVLNDNMCSFRVKILSANNILVSDDGSEVVFPSFRDLSDYINKKSI